MRFNQKRPFSQRTKQGGFIAAEFIFALIIAAGISIVFFAINFTLSMAEVAQYIAFSTARSYAAADLNVGAQEANAREKFSSLMSNPTIKALFRDDGWFKITNLELRGTNSSNFDSDYGLSRTPQTGVGLNFPPIHIPQTGVRFNFTPRLLNLRVALIGRTSIDGKDYGAKITGLLIREPTWEECFNGQVRIRYETIVRDIDPRFQDLAKDTKGYLALEDNGC